VVVAGGGPALRAALAAVYAALAIDVDPAVAGALDEALPGVAVEQVAARAPRRLRGGSPARAG
jgi:hypothetical protein